MFNKKKTTRADKKKITGEANKVVGKLEDGLINQINE